MKCSIKTESDKGNRSTSIRSHNRTKYLMRAKNASGEEFSQTDYLELYKTLDKVINM